MSSRPSPYDKASKDLTRPPHQAAFQAPNLQNKKSHTFPGNHNHINVNPVEKLNPRVSKLNATSSSNNRTVEPGARDHERWDGDSESWRLMASMVRHQRIHRTTQNHPGEEINVENGKQKGRRKTNANDNEEGKSNKKDKKRSGIMGLLRRDKTGKPKK